YCSGCEKYASWLVKTPCGFYIGSGKPLTCFLLVFTKVLDAALRALGRASHADVAPMQDQPVMGVEQERCRNDFFKLAFDFDYVFTGGDPGAVGNAKDMRINRDRGMPECRVEHHVRRFPSYAGQGLKRFPVFGNPAAVLFQ